MFWKAGNGLFLDLGPDYMGVYFYKLSKPTDVFYALLYISDFKIAYFKKKCNRKENMGCRNLDEV